MSALELLERTFEGTLKKLYVGDKRIQERAWERFLALGLPKRADATFQQLKLRDLYTHSYATPIEEDISKEDIEKEVFKECQGSFLVFVNGIFKPDLSDTSSLPRAVVVAPLTAAMKTYASFLNARFSKELLEEKDPFVLLNTALFREGVFVYLPPQVCVESPLQILHVSISGYEQLHVPRCELFLGKGSSLKLVSTFLEKSPLKHWFNGVVDVTLDTAARFESTFAFQNPSSSWRQLALRSTLKRDSHLKTLLIGGYGALLRGDFFSELIEEGALSELLVAVDSDEKHENHINALMEHKAPHTSSMQKVKGVLKDHSRLVFSGKIYVHPAALKTEAYQLNNNLLLSEKAMALSRPELEIFADDVKASHGATTGQIDEEALFYLTTRGISKEKGRELLLAGFLKEIYDEISFPSLRALL